MKEITLQENIPHSLVKNFGDPVLLDIRTDGHFFRTGKLLNAAVTFSGSEDRPGNSVLLSADPSVESDEYDLLLRLGELLKGKEALMTFHGTSSVLPFLSKKFKFPGDNPGRCR